LVSCLYLSLFLLGSGCGDEKPTKPNPGDTTPPGAIQNLHVTSPTGLRVTLTWNAPGDDGATGQAAAYDIRYAATAVTEETWAAATSLTAIPLPRPAGDGQSLNITGLPYGVWHFAMKTADEVPNWSPLSNVVSATVGDFVPPDRVVSLLVSFTTARAATLSWIAPGNDGATGRAAEYDLRYALATITSETWDAATRVQNVPAPKDAGASEAFTVTDLENGQTYSFALKTADDAHNWSVLSNVASALVVDYMAPSQVTDLTVWSTAPQGVTLGWTAPGNNSTVGRAAEYDLRYSLEEIRDHNWEAATRVAGVPAPDTAGATERFTVTGLEAGQTYSFALKTADEAPNWSTVSNAASGSVSNVAIRRLTRSPTLGSGATNPSWSPDGQSILFQTHWTEQYYTQIYRIPASGGTPVQLTNYLGDNTNPSWSPDGNRFVFISGRNGHDPQELWIMAVTPGATATLLIQENMNLNGCKWSPDGSRIAYCKYSTDPWQMNVYVIPAAGGEPRALTDGTAFCDSPSWSPDGAKIAYSRAREGGGSDIWVVPADGGDAVQLTDDDAYNSNSSWSPDGSRIVFVSGQGMDQGLWIMSANGDNPVQLTHGFYTAHPVFSPDGSEIAFDIWTLSGQFARSDIWILKLE
jgi:Tol biopolymer transport system component